MNRNSEFMNGFNAGAIYTFTVIWILLLVVFCYKAWGAEPAYLINPRRAADRIGLIFFHDTDASNNRRMSCATCHSPDSTLGYSDGLQVAIGARETPNYPIGILGFRNTSSLINVIPKNGIDNREVMREGRIKTVFTQCLVAVTDNRVLQLPNIATLLQRLNSSGKYVEMLRIAYSRDDITESILRTCLTYFIASLRWDNLPADRLAAGLKTDLPPAAIRGWHVFQRNCITCHEPTNDWSSDSYYNIGVSVRTGNGDLGRANVTGNAADNNKFKPCRLAGVALTAPYMHDGTFATLREVVNYKGNGGAYKLRNNQTGQLGDWIADVNRDPLIKQIKLDEREQVDVVTFLELGFQGPGYPEYQDPSRPPLVAGAK